MNAGEIEGDDFIVSKAPAGHGVGAELAHAHLMAPAAASLADQIVAAQSLENLSYPEGSLYTSQALVNAVKRALDKAAAD